MKNMYQLIDWQQLLHPEIWAKSPNRVELAPDEGGYHPLICHMIDTAMVVLRIWRYVIPLKVKEQIRKHLGLATLEETGRWVAFFAGLHDLGKATPSFEQCWDFGWKFLIEKGYCKARSEESKPHGILSTYLLQTILLMMGVRESVASPVAVVLGGHHGLFPSAMSLEGAKRFVGAGLWDEARVNLVKLLAHVLGVDQASVPDGDLTEANASLMLLAGLISVADWIASDHKLFPFAGANVSLPRYPRRARWLAWKALYKLGWYHRPAAFEPCSFQELFNRVPNCLQEQVMAIAPRLLGPSLVLLEYPMGGGKTEAALYLADYLAATAGQRGAYFALPTMATSNQMFGRVNSYLVKRFPGSTINVQLLHGHASLNAEFEVLKRIGGELIRPIGISDGETSRLLAAEWFTYMKRGLLAPYGIGTIDQVLLAVLQTKHFFVRLFGLAGKVVILDEVHAYDTYMKTLLTQLLEWLAACGSSVILLSATLPASTRQALLTAYAAGLGQPMPPETRKKYPRISWVTGNGDGGTHYITGATERKVSVRFHSQTDNSWMLDLKENLTAGGCAAVIANTVTRAQQVYQQLQQCFQPEELLLFHARYPFDDRMQRERMVLERFGPEATVRPHRAVVVATQVIEQSLDLDFDLMVTDLAPIDLILQRSGRVWRHPNTIRPPSLVGPALWILMPPLDDDGRPVFEKGSKRIYDRHTLLRTWLVLRNCDELIIPNDVEELVEAVYREEPAPEGLPDAIRALWTETKADLDDDEWRDRSKALKRHIPDVTSDFFATCTEALDENDETLHQAFQTMATRLGGPSVDVVCLTVEDGKLWSLGEKRREIDLDKCPDKDDVRVLLGCSLRISFDPHLVQRILKQQPQSSWQDSPHLRRHRVLQFGPDGSCLTEGMPLRLDPNLGLVYMTKGKEEEI